MEIKRFSDPYRGDGWYISGNKWTVAFRWRWHLYFIKPDGKPSYRRFYVGPFEFEWRGGK